MFCLCTGKGFGEGVGSHVIGGAIDEFDVPSFNNVLDVVISNVDVFGLSMV
jgi:hypothetical protein